MKKISLSILLFFVLTFQTFAAVELDTDGNQAIDINRGGTNAKTAGAALSNLGGQPYDADLDILSSGSFSQKRALIEAFAKPVLGVDALRTTMADFDGDCRYLVYHTAYGDGGHGTIRWDASSTAADDNGVTIAVTGVATGRWIRQVGDRSVTNLRWYGVSAELLSDITAAFHLAVSVTPVGGTVYIPAGRYKVSGTTTRPLLLEKAVSIRGDGQRSTRLIGIGCDPESTILTVNINNAAPYSDVRGWSLEGVGIEPNEGKFSIDFAGDLGVDGLQLLTANIRDCAFGGSDEYSFLVTGKNKLAHSVIELCTFNKGAYLKFGDANVIRDCMFLGTPRAIVFELANGVRNNVVRDCTIVCRDGAVLIKDGSNIRIVNNQIEQFAAYGENTTVPSASLMINGVTDVCKNIIIESNNFGGGTNVDYSIYMNNAEHCIVSKNNFVASDEVDVYLTTLAKYNVIASDNNCIGTVSNPRSGDTFKLLITALGSYNYLTPVAIVGINGWTYTGDCYRTPDGLVVFTGTFSGGTFVDGTAMCVLPPGLRPVLDVFRAFPGAASPAHRTNGTYLEIVGTNGEIRIYNAPVIGGDTYIAPAPFVSRNRTSDG